MRAVGLVRGWPDLGKFLGTPGLNRLMAEGGFFTSAQQESDCDQKGYS